MRHSTKVWLGSRGMHCKQEGFLEEEGIWKRNQEGQNRCIGQSEESRPSAGWSDRNWKHGVGAELSPEKNKEVGSCITRGVMLKISPHMLMSMSQMLYREADLWPWPAFCIHSSSCTVEGRVERQSQSQRDWPGRNKWRNLRDAQWTCGLTGLFDTQISMKDNATMFNLRWETWGFESYSKPQGWSSRATSYPWSVHQSL